MALNAADLLKSETEIVTRFFCQQKGSDQDIVTAEAKESTEQSAGKDVFIKEGEQLVLDNEEIYINDLLSEGEYPHLENLFGFINESRESFNPTAAHYFTEIVSALLKREPECMLNYIYARKHVIDFLVDNCDYQSTKNLLARILNLSNEDGKSNVSFKFFKHRFTLYSRLLKEDENVVDAEYFVERLFEEPGNFKRLIGQIATKESPRLVELVELVMEQVFKKESDFWKSKQQEADEVKKSVVRKPEAGHFEIEESRNRIIEDNIEVEVQIEPMDEEKKENQATAETSNDAIKNLDLEAYDPDEMKRMDLVAVLEAGLPAIISVLKAHAGNTTMHPDGTRVVLSSTYKVSVAKLLKFISKMEYRSLKDILVEEDALRLYLVN